MLANQRRASRRQKELVEQAPRCPKPIVRRCCWPPGPLRAGRGGGRSWLLTGRVRGPVINEYRDPKGLQRRLERLGVRAVIDCLPFGTTCREPRADFEPDNSDLFAWSDLEPGAKSAPLLLRADRITPGQTLVFVAWLEEWGGEHASVSIGLLANGPVKPCERIPGGPNLTPDGRLQPEGTIEPTR